MENRVFFASSFVAFGVILGGMFFGTPNVPAHEKLKESNVTVSNSNSDEGNAVTAEKRTADYTWWLDAWTAGLVVVASGQAAMFSVQLLFMRRGMADTKAAADAAKTAAMIANSDFIASHRPRLRVRNVVVRPEKSAGMFDEVFRPGRFVTGQLYISNVGDTPARVTETLCLVHATNIPIPMERPYEAKSGTIYKDLILLPGQSQPLPFQSEFVLGERQAEAILRGGNQQLYVMGWVSYRDKNAALRRTAFCRKYNAERRRFFAVDDPDYEHEE